MRPLENRVDECALRQSLSLVWLGFATLRIGGVGGLEVARHRHGIWTGLGTRCVVVATMAVETGTE